MSASVFRHYATGNGPINEAFTIPAGCVYRVISVTWHINVASTTALEYLDVTHDSADSALCDVLLYRLDPNVAATIDLVWQPDADYYMLGGDGLDITWANAQHRTWGLMVTMEVVR